MNFNPFGDPFKAGFSAAKDVFALRTRFRGVGRGPRKSEQPAQQEEEPEATPTQEEPKEEKVVLRNPKWEAETVGFNEETPVSVEVTLPEAHKNKKKVLFELYALTPADPERISQVEGFLDAAGTKATGKIPVYQPGYRDEAGDLLYKVDYYFTAKHSQSDLLKDDKVTKTVDGKADRVIESHVLEDMTFDTDSAFLHPRNAPALKTLVERIAAWKKKYPEGTLAIFGHTDAVGQEDYNKGLSERRAKAVHAFLTREPAVLEKLYGEEKWGLKAVQALLKHLGHDPGAIDGVDGQKTQGAMKAFQESQGLAADGKNTPASREGLFKAFIAGLNDQAFDKKLFEDMGGSPFQGCSEFNLLEDTQGALEKNRRVTVLLLKDTKKFPLNYPCKAGDHKACQAQVKKEAGKRRKPSFKCFFYDELVKEEGGGGGGSGGKVELPDYDPGKVDLTDPSGCGTEDEAGGGSGGGDLPGAVFATDIVWGAEKARCGGKVKLTAKTDLPDGTEVTVKYATEDLKCDEAKVKAMGGKIEHEWLVKGVGFAHNEEKKVLNEVDVAASLEADGKKASPDKPLTVLTLVKSDPLEFDKSYTWGIYGVHAKFTQKVWGRNQKVMVKKKVLKTWGATYVNLKDAGIKDAIKGMPWAGHRWARSKSGSMVPEEYWDGKLWKAIPDGVLDDPQTFGTLPIVKTGDVYHHPGDKSMVWPDTFKDYEFDAKPYADKRKVWKDDSDKRWTGAFKLRRKGCSAEPKTLCCTYEVGLEFEMVKTDKYDDHTLCLAPGNLRSNAGLMFYGETRIPMCAHEVGHLVGLPDEYPGGAVDTKATGDGLNKGIDQTTLMGGDMMSAATTRIKKRHYSNFAEMAKRLLKAAGGGEQEWVAV